MFSFTTPTVVQEVRYAATSILTELVPHCSFELCGIKAPALIA
jgi:hypothetical protein